MKNNAITIKEMVPPTEDFNRLRELVGWGRIDNELVAKGLKNSLYSLCAFDNDAIVGICRLVGDGALKIYVEELIIHPARNTITGLVSSKETTQCRECN